jgi:hypothetical protein
MGCRVELPFLFFSSVCMTDDAMLLSGPLSSILILLFQILQRSPWELCSYSVVSDIISILDVNRN